MFSSSPSAQTLTLFWLVSPFFSLASASRLTGGSAGTAASNTGSLHSSSSDIGWNKTTTSRPYTYGSTASSSSSMGKSPGTVVSAKPSYPSSHGSVGWNNAVSAHGTGIAGGSGIGTGRMYGKNATTATPTKPSNSSLPFCKISSTTSSVNTKPTSWVTGACRQTYAIWKSHPRSHANFITVLSWILRLRWHVPLRLMHHSTQQAVHVQTPTSTNASLAATAVIHAMITLGLAMATSWSPFSHATLFRPPRPDALCLPALQRPYRRLLQTAGAFPFRQLIHRPAQPALWAFRRPKPCKRVPL